LGILKPGRAPKDLYPLLAQDAKGSGAHWEKIHLNTIHLNTRYSGFALAGDPAGFASAG